LSDIFIVWYYGDNDFIILYSGKLLREKTFCKVVKNTFVDWSLTPKKKNCY